MPEVFAGIDIGTSGVKAGVFDAGGEPLGLGRASYHVETPRPGWAECAPERWWRGVVKSLGEALEEARDGAGVGPSDIRGVGVSVLYPAVVPLDGEGRALHPAILYCDQRSLAQVRDIEKRIPREEYEAIVGNRLVPGTCAVTSMAWLREKRPQVYARARTLGFANTFALARLTGEVVTDASNASLSGLASIRQPWHWSEELCDRLDVDPALLPTIIASHEVAGTVTKAAAAETGLAEGTPVVAGSGDVAASAVGAGLTSGGRAVDIAGSSDSLAVPMGRPSEERSCVNSAYFARNTWLGIGANTSSGASVDWFAREFLGGGDTAACWPPHRQALSRMTELAASSPPGARGLLFTPYLQGERVPLWDPLARGGFLGITATTTLADLARAVFEGTAFSFRQIVESLESFAGTPVGEIRAVGGGTKNALWNRIKADVLQRELRVLRFQETGTRGAAMLAAVGAGVYESPVEAARVSASADAGMCGPGRCPDRAGTCGPDRCPDRAEAVEPNPALADLYGKLFDLYSDVYPRTSEIAHELGGAAGRQ